MIKIENISFAYEKKLILEDLSVSFPKEKISCILGPSGCGKTTILNLLGGILHFKKGSLTPSSLDASYVFQDLALVPWMTVYENMKFVLKGKLPKTILEDSILHSLRSVELESSKNKFPRELSGGMKQRLALARAFSYPSNYLLLDEPFVGLNPKMKASIHNLFLSLWEKEKKTVVMVTHDLDEALTLCDYIFVANDTPIKKLKMFTVDKSGSLPYFNELRESISKLF